MGVMTGRTGNPVPIEEWERHSVFSLNFHHIIESPFFRLHQEMSLKEAVIGHGGMAPPAEEGHISLEGHRHRTDRLVRNSGMTDEADRFPIDLSYRALLVRHAMRVYTDGKALVMTEKTDLCSRRIGPSSQEHRPPRATLFPVHLMTRETLDLSIKKRKGFAARIHECTLRYEIYRMVVIAVMMAIETAGRGLYPFRE